MSKFEVIDDERLNALGEWFDEHWDEVEAGCEEAERRGDVYTLEQLGAKDWKEGFKKLSAMREGKKWGKSASLSAVV